MKKATIFISTAALMAGTACGVWAETNESAAASFDRAERSVYDSNVAQYIAPTVDTQSGVKYSSAAVLMSGGSSRTDANADANVGADVDAGINSNSRVNTGASSDVHGHSGSSTHHNSNARTNTNVRSNSSVGVGVGGSGADADVGVGVGGGVNVGG